MSKKMVGVDIGSTSIRAVEIVGVDEKGYARISRVGIADIPPGAVVAGRVRSPRDVSVGLVRALRSAGLPRQGFVLGFTSPDLALTNMVFPATVRASEREGAIRSMNRPLGTTFALENSVIATYLAGSSVTPEGISMSTIGVAAALDEDVNAIKTVCELARCSPLAVDLTGAAVLRSLVRVRPESGEVGTVVDVGASKVMVVTRQGMLMRSIRTTVGAGDDITRAIASAARCEFEEAEERKFALKLSMVSSDTSVGYGFDDQVSGQNRRDPVESGASSAVDLLVDSIAQSIEADAANFGSMSQGVTLTGGTAMLQGFRNRLQQRLGIPVSTGRPWAEIERSRKTAAFFRDGRADPRMLILLAPAVGLALWKDRS
jgi:type IV pilus assembly protein PilM